MFKLNEKLESVWSNNRQNPRGWPTNGIVIDYRIKAIKGFWPETTTLTLYKNTLLKQEQTQIVVLCLQCDLHFVRSTVFKSLPLEYMGQIWRQRRLTSCQGFTVDCGLIDRGFPSNMEVSSYMFHGESIKYHRQPITSPYWNVLIP